MIEVLSHVLVELMSLPAIATFFGFLFGVLSWLRNVIIVDNAPLRVIQDTLQLLGVVMTGWRLPLSTSSLMKRNTQYLIECMDDLSLEQQKFQFYYRSLSHLQAQL